MINWDNKQREVLRLALQKAYTDYGKLEMFVDEKLDVPLAKISPNIEFDQVAFKLVSWAKTNNKLDELFEQFCQANPQTKNALIAGLQPQPLICCPGQFSSADWDKLLSI